MDLAVVQQVLWRGRKLRLAQQAVVPWRMKARGSRLQDLWEGHEPVGRQPCKLRGEAECGLPSRCRRSAPRGNRAHARGRGEVRDHACCPGEMVSGRDRVRGNRKGLVEEVCWTCRREPVAVGLGWGGPVERSGVR